MNDEFSIVINDVKRVMPRDEYESAARNSSSRNHEGAPIVARNHEGAPAVERNHEGGAK